MKNDYYFKDWKLYDIYGNELYYRCNDTNMGFIKILEKHYGSSVKVIYIPRNETALAGISYLEKWNDEKYGYLNRGYNVLYDEEWNCGAFYVERELGLIKQQVRVMERFLRLAKEDENYEK